MANPEVTTNGTDNSLNAGDTKTMYKTLQADDYFRGQILARITATNVYGPYDGGGAGGLEIPRAICIFDEVLAAPLTRQVLVSGSEVRKGALVDETGAALTVTVAIIEKLQDVNILVKEN